MSSFQNVAQRIATLLIAIANCQAGAGNPEWEARHGARLDWLVRETLPSGAGFDNGSTLDLVRSRPDMLVFETSFHHMDAHGGYAGWTDHKVVVRPSLAFGFTLTVGGRNRNDIKDYITETFHNALGAPAPAYPVDL